MSEDSPDAAPAASTPVQAVRAALADRTLLITVGLFALLALKLLIIARGRVPVALAILQSAPVATAIVGSFVSAVPLVVFACTAWPVFRMRRRTAGQDQLVALLLLGLVIGAYVAPWLVVVAGLLTGGLLRLSWSSREQRVRRPIALTLVTVATLYAVWVFLDAVWVPHESVHTMQGPPLIGYVLDSGGEWTSILLSSKRLVVRLPSATIQSRQICVRRSHKDNPLSNEAPSLWQLLGDVVPQLARAPLPICS